MNKNILFINPLGENIFLIKFLDGNIFQEILKIPFLQFTEQFPHKISSILKQNNYDEIWLITGPGPFTKIRITTLVINTIPYKFPKIQLKSLHFFDFFRQQNTIIPILEANKKEYLILENGEEKFIQKENIGNGNFCGYILQEDTKNFTNFCYFENNPNTIQEFFNKAPVQKLLTPFYIKPPHITCSKK